MDDSRRHALRAGLEMAPTVLRSLIDDSPDDRLNWSPRRGIWTIRDHLHHLAVTQQMLAGRLKSFLENERPRIVPFRPEGGNGPQPDAQTTASLLDDYQRSRSEQLETIGTASVAVWSRKADHPEYEVYDFGILVRHILVHDYFHFHRIEELAFSNPDQITDL